MSHVTLSDDESSQYKLPPPAEFKLRSSFVDDAPLTLGRFVLLVVIAAAVAVAVWLLTESKSAPPTAVAAAPQAPVERLETQEVFTELPDLLVVQNATLEQILTQLQTYGTDRFVIKDVQLGGVFFGGAFYKGPTALADGLRRLQRMAPIQYTRKGNLFVVEYVKPDAN